MASGDLIFLVLLGAVVIGLAWLASELQRLRESIEPIATSPLVRTLSTAGV